MHWWLCVALACLFVTRLGAEEKVLAGAAVITFSDPAPALGDRFGFPLASVGPDQVLIGASQDDLGAVDAGAAYLFNTNGARLTTFTNPTPELRDYFGFRLAAVGTDKVAIGAYEDGPGATGAAYLFATDGRLLATFKHPNPSSIDYFGETIAALGDDKILISTDSRDGGNTTPGVVFLFDTNAALLTTFTNPSPALADNFGNAVAALGSDYVLIGAPQDDAGAFDAGVAHLFRADGLLLHTFTNPAPGHSDHFGSALGVLDQQHLVIGAPEDDTGAIEAGTAYLFHTNGSLITVFTNPNPASYESFGSVLAPLGEDRLLIGAPSDARLGGVEGTIYLFRTNGTPIAAFCAPISRSLGGGFGASLAVFGPDTFATGFHQDDLHGDNAGTAFLFHIREIPLPALSFERLTPYQLRLSWPISAMAFRIDESYTADLASTGWREITTNYQTNLTHLSIIVPYFSGSRFYRLRYP